MSPVVRPRKAEPVRTSKKQIFTQQTLDGLRAFAQWLVVTALAFFYWMAMLLMFSLILLNVWHTSFTSLLIYGGVLTAITSIVYIFIMVHRARNK